jgi:Fe-S-cluster-containing hydrogenase component 2
VNQQTQATAIPVVQLNQWPCFGACLAGAIVQQKSRSNQEENRMWPAAQDEIDS